jgi:predicted naringenin-chalcone synthase
VEICSADFQMDDDLSLIVSNALFGDGAAAFSVSGNPGGLAIVDFAALHFPEFREDLRFVYRNGQLHNQLSSRLPGIVGEHIGPFTRNFLGQHGLDIRDIDYWAVHAGGENILQAIEQELALPPAALETSRSILRDFGNMSSPSALFSLEAFMKRDFPRKTHGLLLTFGAGFQIQAALLRGPGTV